MLGRRRPTVVSLAASQEETPLQRLLRRIADDKIDEKYRDQLCVWVLPYLHAKPQVGQVGRAANGIRVITTAMFHSRKKNLTLRALVQSLTSALPLWLRMLSRWPAAACIARASSHAAAAWSSSRASSE